MKLLLLILMFFGASSNDYIKRFVETAQQEQKKFDIPASIKLAQAITETRYGTSKLALKGNNHFGIKYRGMENIPESIRPYVTGYIIIHDDCKNKHIKVNNINKTKYTIVDRKNKIVCPDPDRFVKYDRAWASWRHHSLFLEKYRRSKPKTYKQWAKALRKYAVNKNYSATLVKVIESNNLHQYDK